MATQRYCSRCGRANNTYNSLCEFCTQNDIIEKQARLDREAADRRANEDRKYQQERQNKIDQERRMEYFKNYVPSDQELEWERIDHERWLKRIAEPPKPKTIQERLDELWADLIQALAVIAVVGSPIWVGILLVYLIFVPK